MTWSLVHGKQTHLQPGNGFGLFGGCAKRDVGVVLRVIHGHDEVLPCGVQEDLMNTIRHSARQLNLRCGQCRHLEHA